MKYALLICGDESHAQDGCGGWTEEVERRGVVRGGTGLRPPSEATTVRVREDSVLLTDGPFAETKEQVGGIVLIECTGLDEAIEIAALHPAASYGSIEIRPLLEL